MIMSPKKVEIRYYQPDRVKVIEIKEKSEGFPAGSADASRILGMPRATLFRYDGSDIQRETVRRGPRTDEARVHNDEALLRIAIESGRVNMRPDDVTNLTVLSVEDCDAFLDIEWSHTQKFMNDFYAFRANKERR